MSVDLHLQPVVQMLDSTIEIYPEDSVMHLVNNWGPYVFRYINTCLDLRASERRQDFVLYSVVAPSIISIRRIVGVFRRSQPNVFLFRICLLAPHTCGDLTRTTASTCTITLNCGRFARRHKINTRHWLFPRMPRWRKLAMMWKPKIRNSNARLCWTGQFFLVIEFDRNDLTTRSSSLGQAGHTS